MKIGVVTCEVLPEIDVDESICLEAFRNRGHDCSLLAWDAPKEPLEAFDLLVIRSTWNYPEHVQPFREWILHAEPRTKLLNPASVLLSNLDKRYLRELSQRGLPIVPSQWYRSAGLESALQNLTQKSVLKPTVGAGSMDTFVVMPGQGLPTEVGFSDPDRVWMIQPYLESIHTVGEQSVIFIGGEPSHQIRKNPRFEGEFESVSAALECDPELVGIAKEAMHPMEDGLLYARADFMQDDAGRWCISELELIEPSLFLVQKPEAADRLAHAAEQAYHRMTKATPSERP